MLAIDHQLGADNYENIGRLKEVERIEMILKEELSEWLESSLNDPNRRKIGND